MAARKFIIPTATADALRTDAAYDGPRVTITRQLGPDTWRGVKTVVEKLGAVYAPGTSAFDFEPDQDARALVMAALAAGWVMSPAQSAGFVATPDDLAAELVDMFGTVWPAPGRTLRVLEPSAGTGAFVRAIMHPERDTPGWLHVTAVEMDARRARHIPTSDAVTVVVDTFEAYAARARDAGERFDVVVMNPPFSTPDLPTMWAEHLMLAWSLLAPGGRLLAIVPASVVTGGRGHLVDAAADLVRRHGGTFDLGRDAFAASGVIFSTVAIWLDRPTVDAATAADFTATSGRPFPYVHRAYTGQETPVTVGRIITTRAAALTMPVQAWRDSWRDSARVLRYLADCASCTRPVWAFDDGENDPRGALGDASDMSFHPSEYGHPAHLPSVAVCFNCGNDADTYNAASAKAHALWARPATPAPAPVVEPAPPAPVVAVVAQPFLSGWAKVAA